MDMISREIKEKEMKKMKMKEGEIQEEEKGEPISTNLLEFLVVPTPREFTLHDL